MNIRIEGGKLVETHDAKKKETKQYYTFWVHVFEGKLSITISCWKYFPDSGRVSTPSAMKGQGRFVNTSRMSREFYHEVEAQAQQYFGGQTKDEEIVDKLTQEYAR